MAGLGGKDDLREKKASGFLWEPLYLTVLRIRIRSFWVTRIREIPGILYQQKDPCNSNFLVTYIKLSKIYFRQNYFFIFDLKCHKMLDLVYKCHKKFILLNIKNISK